MPENVEPDVSDEGAQAEDAAPPVGDGGGDRAGGERAVLADLARERDRRQALEREIADVKSAQQTQLDAIAKALGLKDDAKVDPDALAAELASTRKAKRDADLRVAIYDAAGRLGANPGALLDSLSFIKSLDDVDPSDAGKLEAAVRAALDTNPGLVAPTRPRPDPTQGPRGTDTGKPDINDLIRAAIRGR